MSALNKILSTAFFLILVGCNSGGDKADNSAEDESNSRNNVAVNSHPSVEELTALLGKKRESPEVTEFKEKNRLKSVKLLGELGLYPEDNAFHFNFADGVVSDIVLQVNISPFAVEELEGDSKYYSGKLPGGIEATDSLEGVSKKIGPGDTTVVPTWIVGPHRLLIEFYDDKDGIYRIIISKAD